MKKMKLIPVILILFICLSGIIYWIFQADNATLAVNKTGSKQIDDFILHIKVEKTNNGICVYRSIQYVGDKPIEITHYTPLVSVSLNNKNHDFTGSPVTKKLEKGNSYHPHGSILVKSPGKGTYDLYSRARFSVDGEEIVIDYVENLVFE
ncbi:hypothetical protein [Virgibacillus oceani]|uniref:Uncharacterized protein n=1 Tax=Virgibacillus oceani TaxID=1479511 RepID=A0A917M1G6_9BACI|nr:hypothetical protein [Virgibacillus oceani]GGG70505.1 hypothetical protein GCM10011398_13290 [Virgibacillus oceani]